MSREEEKAKEAGHAADAVPGPLREEVRTQASRLGLLGWVRLMEDGTLCVHAEGGRRSIDELAAYVGSLAGVETVAERPASTRGDLDESRIGELCFLGFLGLADPVRPTAAQSVRRLARAGVRVVMITGDHPSTAESATAGA